MAKARIAQLTRQLEKVNEILSQGQVDYAAYEGWVNTSRGLLDKIFGSESRDRSVFLTAIGLPMVMNEDDRQRSVRIRANRQEAILRSCIDQLEMELSMSTEAASSDAAKPSPVRSPSKVFLVHGHSEKEAVARFLEKLGLHVTILAEEPGKGRTIIEKFIAYADSGIGYAVVLLTADDMGYSIKGGPDSIHKRARQNAFLELGYFTARLSRENVCALCEPEIEIPTDIVGVEYIPFDAGGGWQIKLFGELKAAGMAVRL